MSPSYPFYTSLISYPPNPHQTNRNLHQNIGQQYVYHLKYLQTVHLTVHYLLQLLQLLGLRNMLPGGILMYVVCFVLMCCSLMCIVGIVG